MVRNRYTKRRNYVFLVLRIRYMCRIDPDSIDVTVYFSPTKIEERKKEGNENVSAANRERVSILPPLFTS